MKLAYILTGLILLLLSQSTAWSLGDDKCDYAGNQSQMNACAVRDFETADRELNVIYKELMGSMPESKHKALQNEQRAWLKSRDPKCKVEANDEAEGGSMWPMLYQSCRANATQARIKILKQWKSSVRLNEMKPNISGSGWWCCSFFKPARNEHGIAAAECERVGEHCV